MVWFINPEHHRDGMRLLFVCVGNTCRSQMAEALAKHKGHEAQSAGTSPGSAVAPEAIEAIGEKGIGMGGQYPKSVDDIDTRGFDRIISMGCGVECPRCLWTTTGGLKTRTAETLPSTGGLVTR